MWTTDTKNTRYILCNLKNELLYVIKLFSGYQGSGASGAILITRGTTEYCTLQCEPPIPTLKTRDIYFAISKMNYCTSLNCSVDIRGASGARNHQMNYCTRGAGRLNHRYFAMWTTDTKNTRYILCNFSKMNYCTSLNCSVDIRGARRLNHRYFAMWTTDTKNTRYILCNLKNELLYVIKLFSGYQGSEAIEPPILCNVNHRY